MVNFDPLIHPIGITGKEAANLKMFHEQKEYNKKLAKTLKVRKMTAAERKKYRIE